MTNESKDDQKMTQAFLWVHKNELSDVLSRSSRREERNIRRHAQGTRDSCKARPAHAEGGGEMVFLGRLGRTRSRLKCGRTASIETQKTLDLPSDSLKKIERPFATGTTLEFSPPELRSFNFFISRTSREWAGWLDFDFWNVIVLQLAHTSKAVAHSLICLSSLHERLEASTDEARATELRYLSISQASKAVSMATTPALSYLEGLASCLILFCVSSLQKGRWPHRLLQSGMRMLAEYDKKSIKSSESFMIENTLRPLFARLACAPCRMNNPRTALKLSLERRKAMYDVDSSLNPLLIPSISYEYNNASEARESLQTILSWGHATIPTQDVSNTRLQEFYDQYRLLSNAWEASLTRMASHNQSIQTWDHTKASKLLKVAALFGRIVTETVYTVTETVYDAYTAEFGEIVRLVDEALSESRPSSQASFGIDNGLSDILAFAGSKCRDPRVRRRAMSILLSSGRREGGRLAYMPGVILKALIELEERGLHVISEKDIPESHRRILLHGLQFYNKKHVKLFFASAVPDPASGESIVDECYVPLLGLHDENRTTSNTGLPDAIFGSGYAAFLDDSTSKRYFHLNLESFHFPIPRT